MIEAIAGYNFIAERIMKQNNPLQIQFGKHGCWAEISIIETPAGGEMEFITLSMDKPDPPLELLKDEKPGKLWRMK